MALSLGIATGCLIAAVRLQQATSAAMLPFEAPDEIVEIRLPDGAMRVDDRVMESGLFEAAGSLFIGEAEVRLASHAARSRVGVVTAGLFEVLRVRHIAGRGLSSDDEMTGAERVAVLGRRYAQRHLSDPAGALGAFVTIDGRRYRVVGVVPDALDAFGRPDVLVPQRGTRGRVVEAVASAREIAFAGVLARLYPPHTAGAAQAYFSRTSATQGISAAEFRVVPLADALFGPVAHQVRAVLLLLLLAVAVGVSGFWIIYGGRFLMGLRHLAIRVALGAGQRRILSHLVRDIAWVVALAILISFAVIAVVEESARRAAPAVADALGNLLQDERAGFAALALSSVIGTVAVLVGHLRLRSLDMGSLLRGSASPGRPERLGRRLGVHGVLLSAEIAATVALLALGIALVQAYAREARRERGFTPAEITTFEWSVPAVAEPGQPLPPGALFDLHRLFIERVEALPGVAAAGAASRPLLSSRGRTRLYVQAENAKRGLSADVNSVLGRYFDAIGAKVIEGDAFDESAFGPALDGIVIDQRLASMLWPDADRVVGRRVRVIATHSLSVVAVIAPISYSEREGGSGHAYVNARRPMQGWLPLTAVARSARPLQERDLEGAVHQVRRDVDVYGVSSGHDLVRGELEAAGSLTTAVGGLPTIGVLLTALGVYGVACVWVQRQRRAIAVRRALGATESDIWRLVSGRFARTVLTGAVAGVSLSWIAGRLLAAYAVVASPLNVVTSSALALALVVLIVAASVAVGIRRAPGTDDVAGLGRAL